MAPEQLTLFDSTVRYRIESSDLDDCLQPKTPTVVIRLGAGTDLEGAKEVAAQVTDFLTHSIGDVWSGWWESDWRMYGRRGDHQVVLRIIIEEAFSLNGEPL